MNLDAMSEIKFCWPPFFFLGGGVQTVQTNDNDGQSSALPMELVGLALSFFHSLKISLELWLQAGCSSISCTSPSLLTEVTSCNKLILNTINI